MITRMELFNSQVSAPELPLGGFMPNNDPVQILNIEGLGPVTAEISSTPFATGRGELHQGSSTGKRNIVLTLGLNPNWTDQTISSLRKFLYAYLMPEQWVKMRFFTDDYPDVQITGVVESFTPNMFSTDPEIQVSILCHKPDFVAVDATIIDGIVDDGTAENEINYIGTVSTGFELQVRSSDDLETYLGNLTIVNETPSEIQTFQALAVTIDPEKYFMINTVKSSRRIQNVLVDQSGTINILAKMVLGSTWLEFVPGENLFSIAADEPGQEWIIGYFNRFGGL